MTECYIMILILNRKNYQNVEWLLFPKVTECLQRFSCNPNTADKSTDTSVWKIDCIQNDGGGDKKG